MSIFSGSEGFGLRSSFSELTATQLSSVPAAVDKSTAKLLHRFSNAARIVNIDVTLRDASNVGSIVSLFLVHPNRDPTDNDNRYLWLKLEGTRVFDASTLGTNGLEFEAGVRIYASYDATVTPTQGAIRILAWG